MTKSLKMQELAAIAKAATDRVYREAAARGEKLPVWQDEQVVWVDAAAELQSMNVTEVSKPQKAVGRKQLVPRDSVSGELKRASTQKRASSRKIG